MSLVAHAEDNRDISFFDGAKTIHLKFTDVVNDEYIVDVLWMPNYERAPALSGPAVISFIKDGGHSFSVSADAFHFPLNMIEGLSLSDSIDLNKVYPIKYDSLKGMSLLDNSHQDLSRQNIAPFFFEDIDFDEKKELILVNTQEGQRHGDSYTIYKPTYKYGNIYNLATRKPFDMLDQKTVFNKENRTIDIFSSGGACANSNERFKLIDGKYVSIKFTNWDHYTDDAKGSVCVESIYTVIDGKRVLKTKSESH